jgi:hypothetical protein
LLREAAAADQNESSGKFSWIFALSCNNFTWNANENNYENGFLIRSPSLRGNLIVSNCDPQSDLKIF